MFKIGLRKSYVKILRSPTWTPNRVIELRFGRFYFSNFIECKNMAKYLDSD